MISLQIFFWLMVLFFAVVGYMRGWQREVIALSGLVASIATLHHFADNLVGWFNAVPPLDPLAPFDPMAMRRTQFWVQALFHATITFFSYQIVGRLADQFLAGRLGERLRTGLEKRIIGMLVGAVNGYLFIGGLWSFLEYQIAAGGYSQLPLGEQYAFDPSIVARPIMDSGAMQLAGLLPMGVLSQEMWLVVFVVTFIVLIVAII
jgi:uncharacterized membrane protein required for colicin V production